MNLLHGITVVENLFQDEQEGLFVVDQEPSEVLANFPEETAHVVLALSILVSRINTLGPKDRDDLFALMIASGKAEDRDEQISTKNAMIEILTQAPVKSKSLSFNDHRLSDGAKKWAKHVGGTIRMLRDKAGLTQVELAKKAGLPQSHISRLENAEHTATNITLGKIAKALGVEIGDIDPCVD